jgi:hypothetical protein
MFELFERDIKVSLATLTYRTNFGSLNPSENLPTHQGTSITLHFVLRLAMRRIDTYRHHQRSVHLTHLQRNLHVPRSRMLYYLLLNVRL